MATVKPRVRVRAGDPIGATVRMSGMAVPEVETAHHAASFNAKDMASWQPYRISPDTALLPELDTIAARSDDLVRNNGIAAGAERTFVDNVIGARIICKPNPDRIAIGRDPEWAAEWSRQVESQWSTFADSDWFDAGLRLNFHSSTRLAVRTVASAGEVIGLLLWLTDRGSKWNTALQLVDPARLSNPHGAIDYAGKMRGGIETDTYGAATAYHIRKTHPGDLYGRGLFGAGEWERIPAYMPWGRRRVLHLFDPDRIGASRGKPLVTAVARQFKMLDHYMREELRVAVLNALIFAALETPLDQAGIIEMFGDSEDPMSAYQEAVSEWRVQLRGGAMIPLPPGTKMAPFTPSRPSSAVDQFSTVMLRYIGAGLNMPYELVAKDFSKTNYSSARASMLEAWRYFLTCRQFIFDRWCGQIYDAWFEEAVNRGNIPDCTPENYYANQIAWTRCKWIASGRGWVDPVKEANAAKIRMATVSTLEDECAEQGKDWRDVLEQRARENVLAKELRIAEPHGAGQADQAIADQAQQDAADRAEQAANDQEEARAA